jgi:hypothetical protein
MVCAVRRAVSLLARASFVRGHRTGRRCGRVRTQADGLRVGRGHAASRCVRGPSPPVRMTMCSGRGDARPDLLYAPLPRLARRRRSDGGGNELSTVRQELVAVLQCTSDNLRSEESLEAIVVTFVTRVLSARCGSSSTRKGTAGEGDGPF